MKIDKRWFVFFILVNLYYFGVIQPPDSSAFQKEYLSLKEDHNEIDNEEQLPEKPIGISRERVSGDVFGRKGGYLHPFLGITEYYTDNVFNTSEDEKSDFVTVISPGIWLTLPHIYERLLKIDTSNVAPGGFTLSRYKPEYFRRYQTYLFYTADIEKFSKYSSEDTVNHKAEGLLQYNFRGGLSAEMIDQFIKSHDARGTGLSTELDKFRSNLINVILTYDLSDRLRFRMDYANFLVDYEASRNDFRDRDDNAVSGYVFYKFKPKTSFFIEYEFVDIRYDKNVLSNSREHHYFGGLQWDITAKSKGSVKAGYGKKDFISSSESGEHFILEVQLDHHFTPKTSLVMKASRKTYETNISTTDYILSNTVEAEYIQRLTGKITGHVNLSYMRDEYKGDLTFAGETKERRDDFYRGSFALQYEFKEWLKTDIGYIYDRRQSNFSDFDYTSNIVFARILGTL